MQRRATLTMLGVLMLLFAPVREAAVNCAAATFGECPNYGSYSRWELIHWPPGWYWLSLPMLIIGVALVVTGIGLMSRRSFASRH
jgi:hypothetical protein